MMVKGLTAYNKTHTRVREVEQGMAQGHRECGPLCETLF